MPFRNRAPEPVPPWKQRAERARAVEVSVSAATRTVTIEAELQQLDDDLAAQAAAHHDVAQL